MFSATFSHLVMILEAMFFSQEGPLAFIIFEVNRVGHQQVLDQFKSLSADKLHGHTDFFAQYFWLLSTCHQRQ